MLNSGAKPDSCGVCNENSSGGSLSFSVTETGKQVESSANVHRLYNTVAVVPAGAYKVTARVNNRRGEYPTQYRAFTNDSA